MPLKRAFSVPRMLKRVAALARSGAKIVVIERAEIKAVCARIEKLLLLIKLMLYATGKSTSG